VINLKTLAIIVNYKAAGLTLRAVQSVLDSASLGPVQVVVVDNSEDKDEAERLRLNLPSGVVLRVNPENIGFGRACNQAFEEFPGELILLINPDARLLPGCLLRLQKTLLSNKRVAAVGPRIFWDEGSKFCLPPSYPPNLFIFQPVLSAWGPGANINRIVSAFWRRHSIKVWRAGQPVKVNNLSGGHVLLKREAVWKVGGLFDPRFFLYFEDTDLFIRLKKAGYTLIIEPRAEVIHHYDQCGQRNWEEKRALMARSHRIFLEKHCKGWKSRVKKILGHFKAPPELDRNQLRVPDFTTPFVLEVPEKLRKGWLFEWSPNPDFIPSAGRFGKGPCMDFPETCWAMLAPGQYFGRLGSPMELGRYSQVVSWIVGDTN
jgi:GT2 family glycosyltransferase